MSTKNQPTVDKSQWVKLVVSDARFKPYLSAVGNRDPEALRLYSLNIAASAEMYAWLGFLEVSLRNALISALMPRQAGQDFDPLISIWAELTPPARSTYEKAKRRLIAQGKQVHLSSILTELPFSFWRYLLSSRYQNSIWRSNLRFAFPGMWPTNRRIIYKALENAVLLRNRIAHHEPIFRRPLSSDLAQIQQVIGWVSEEALNWAKNNLPKEVIGVDNP